MTFQNPYYLLFLLILLPIVFWYIWEMRKNDASLQVSTTYSLQRRRTWRTCLLHVPFILLISAITLLIIALARPQLTNKLRQESTEGIDIMMVVDISGTMQAEDLRPNRLEAAKTVACDFINNRPDDNIGLVVFAGESFTQCPMTTDHNVLINLFSAVQFGMIDDGTAIGLGIANAVNRMKDSKTKSKVIILLTDGSNNRGDIDPTTAAEIAKTYGIRIYAIGVGSYGKSRVPVQTPLGKQYVEIENEFDENTLRQIAQATDGAYFRATDNQKLQAIYQEIDQMEKTKMQVREYAKRSEYFPPFLWAALGCLIVSILLRYVVLRTISN